MNFLLNIITKLLNQIFKEPKKKREEVRTIVGIVDDVVSGSRYDFGGTFVYLISGSEMLQLWSEPGVGPRVVPGAKICVDAKIVTLSDEIAAFGILNLSVITDVAAQVESDSNKYGGKPPGHYVGWHDKTNHKMNNWEPFHTGKLGIVESVLWKPSSDNTKKPVVVVSCDMVPRNELYIEITDNTGTILDSKLLRKSRGNPIHTYSRINFYLANSKEMFSESSPIILKFYQKLDGNQKTYLEIKMKNNKSYNKQFLFVVENPLIRKDKR